MFRRRRDCRWIACLLWLFTGALGLLLLAQIPFVLLFAFSREIHLPARWVEKLASRAAGDGFSVRLGSATLDETGTLRFRRISLHTPTGRPVAEAEFLEVDLFVPSVFLGRPRVEEAGGRNLRLRDFEGPLGNPEPVASVERFHLVRGGSGWIVEDFRARSGDLRLAAAGRIDTGSWDALAAEPEPPPGEEFFERILEAKARMDRFTEPFLFLRFDRSGAGTTRARLTTGADRAELPFGLTLAGNPRLTFDATLDGGGFHPGEIRLSAGELTQGGRIRVEAPRLRLTPPPGFPGGAVVSGGRARLSARSVETAGGVLSFPTFSLQGRAGLRFAVRGQAGLFGNPVSIEAFINPLRRTIDVSAAGPIDTGALLRHPRVPPEARGHPPRFEEDLFVRASTRFDIGEPLPGNIRFRAESGPMDLKGMRALHASVIADFDPAALRLSVESLSVQTQDYHFEGTYRQDFGNNRFRLRMRGGFLPGDIDGWMGPWWAELWEDFEINDVPRVDIDLRGDWDHRDQRRLFGGIRFENITFNGMAIERGHARLRSLPYLFELFDLRAFRPEGEIRGSTGDIIDPVTRDRTVRFHDLTSTVDFAAIAPLFGKEVREFVSDFELTAPPELTIRGTLLPGADGDERENLLIRAHADRPLTYRGIALDSLVFDARYGNGVFRCEPVRFTLGKGTGEGWLIRRRRETEGGIHSAGLTFTGGDPVAVVRAVPVLREAFGERFERDGEEARESRNLDFSIECSGDIDDPATLLGEGSLDLATPNLANIRLLGFFSRISEELPLPLTLGSFRFERVSSSFLLNRGLVEVPDLTLHSASSRVLASGAYDMDKGTIDFNARMQLLGEVRFPILAQLGNLLNPVGRVFEFRVWGDPDDPDWRLYLDPRSWQ
ncbi:MAG: AsmA-like C-terminal region-containing protein [Puniceicoccaceae bacterium]